MAGIYIHIPFCRSRCTYCGFFSTTQLELRQQYVDDVCQEMTLRGGTAETVDTIYLGGGTPSQLTPAQLGQLFLYINKVYGASNATEVTLEMNPDDITHEYVETLSQLPVNRVSMGTQTFDDRRLRFLNRRHTAAQVPEAVERLRRAGISNISIDLMYGFPGESIDDWQRDIEAALALNVEHLSAYSLIYEEGTPLYRQLQQGLITETDEDMSLRMYEMLIDRLTAAGYEHYEISNFSRPGFRSRHNSSYWQDVPYIGLGAAAHSYDGHYRSWNVSDLRRYMDAIEHGTIPCERELIDDDTHYNDRVTVALRTCDGLDLSKLSDRHHRYCLDEAQRFLDNGLLRLDGNHLVLTRKGLFVSDYVMSSLIWVDDR